MRTGRETNFESGEILKMYKSLKNGETLYSDVAKLCDASGCRGGFRVNNITNKIEECPYCKGYGIIRI